MRTVEIDREGASFRVSWRQGLQPLKTRRFDTRGQAEAFAIQKMGARGCVISTLDMSVEQLSANKARQARAAAFMAAAKASA